MDPVDRACAEAIAERLSQSVVAFARRQSDTNESEVFSGVGVEIENRYFIATAGHCVEGEDHLDSYHLISAARPWSDRPAGNGLLQWGMVEATNRRTAAPIACDIGLVELRRGFADELRLDWIKTDAIKSGGVGPADDLALMGFPDDRISPAPALRGAMLRPSMFLTRCTTRDEDKYDEVSGNYSPPHHLLLELPDNFMMLRGTDESTGHSTDGLSGSGVFRVPKARAESRLWTPSDALLVGIYNGDFPRAKMMFVHRSEFVEYAIREWFRVHPNPPPSFADLRTLNDG